MDIIDAHLLDEFVEMSSQLPLFLGEVTVAAGLASGDTRWEFDDMKENRELSRRVQPLFKSSDSSSREGEGGGASFSAGAHCMAYSSRRAV